jgi:hypothetical protein
MVRVVVGDENPSEGKPVHPDETGDRIGFTGVDRGSLKA